MTPERFCECLDAYGADLRRWPQEEYAAACALAEKGFPDLNERIAHAAAFDALLRSDPIMAPDEALIRRISASAPPRKHPASAQGESWWRPLWKWPASLAGVGLAGTLAGAFFVSVALQRTPPAQAVDRVERGTAFSAVPMDWSEE